MNVINANSFVNGRAVHEPPLQMAQRDYVRVKAISLWQPWASLIVLGEKRYETRSWAPALKRGDWLLIHAAKKWSGELLAYCKDPLVAETLAKWGITDPKSQLPFGAALGLCRYIAAWKTDDFIPLRKERKLGDYSPNRFAWELELVHVFDKPVQMTGAQGLFSVEIPAALMEKPSPPADSLGEGETKSAVIIDQITGAGEMAIPTPHPLAPVSRHFSNAWGEGELSMVDEVAALDELETVRVGGEVAALAAKRLLGMLRGTFERAEIAGSVRREASQVKDVEIVIIPKAGMLARLDEMLTQGHITKADYGGGKTRWGDQYRGLVYEGVKIEIFATDPDGWGYQLWLRTGPGDAGRAFMSALNARSNYRAIDGHIWHSIKGWRREGEKWEASDRVMMSLPEERDFFGLIGLPVVPPALRSAATYQALWRREHVWGNPNTYKKKLVRATRYDESRYGMLPKWHPQRDEYESNSPVMWKHRLLPLSISYYEGRIEEVRAEGKSTFDLERLLEAERARWAEGVESIKEGRMRE